MDYADRYPEAFVDLSKWLSEGRITRKFHVVEGLEKAPESLPLLFSGGNTGKLFVLVFLYPISHFSDSMGFLGLFTSRALKRNYRESILTISITKFSMASAQIHVMFQVCDLFIGRMSPPHLDCTV